MWPSNTFPFLSKSSNATKNSSFHETLRLSSSLPTEKRLGKNAIPSNRYRCPLANTRSSVFQPATCLSKTSAAAAFSWKTSPRGPGPTRTTGAATMGPRWPSWTTPPSSLPSCRRSRIQVGPLALLRCCRAESERRAVWDEWRRYARTRSMYVYIHTFIHTHTHTWSFYVNLYQFLLYRDIWDILLDRCLRQCGRRQLGVAGRHPGGNGDALLESDRQLVHSSGTQGRNRPELCCPPSKKKLLFWWYRLYNASRRYLRKNINQLQRQIKSFIETAVCTFPWKWTWGPILDCVCLSHTHQHID